MTLWRVDFANPLLRVSSSAAATDHLERAWW